MTFPHSWEFPYGSQRMPVIADSVVATSQPLATQAGVAVMRAGGNAVDAALAAAITLTVVEPTSNGIGSDAFGLLWDGSRLHGFNGSGRAPAALSPERFRGKTEIPETGWEPVTVPGAVDSWVQLSERFGRLPFEALFADAIRYAREGFAVSPVTARAWAGAAERFRRFPGFEETFLPGGRAPGPGERFHSAGQARTLEEIAQTKGESFYRGALAAKIGAHARSSGGLLTEADLGAHRGEWVAPLEQEFCGGTLHELPPNGQGLAALIAVGILRQREIATLPPDSADALHLQVEAMRIAFAEAAEHVGDPAFMDAPLESFLDERFLAAGAAEIDMAAAGTPRSRIPRGGGTVYLATADAEGRMVSFIQSNFQGFGSGIVIPDTGISLQNRGHGFSLEAGHPNQAAGNKRPFHTIIPGFVTGNGKPLLAFGVMGGHMQAQGHVQMMTRIFAWHQNPQAAADAPRFFLRKDSSLALEAGIAPEVADELRRRGHRVVYPGPEGAFGGAQLVQKLGDGWCAASDPRKDGQAAGF